VVFGVNKNMKQITVEKLLKNIKKEATMALKIIKDMENLENLETPTEETPVEEINETPSEAPVEVAEEGIVSEDEETQAE
jgi:hypothetical protein